MKGKHQIMVAPFEGLPNVWHLRIELPLSYEETEADIYPLPTCDIALYDDHVHLSGVWVPYAMRRKQLGTVLVAAALKWIAGKWPEKPIMIEVHPYGREALGKDVLRAWYRRFGFEPWPGHPSSMCLWPKEEEVPR